LYLILPAIGIVPDTACHWYVVNPDNTFGKGFSWITAPEYDVEALQDIAIQHEFTVQDHCATDGCRL
jgi:hypothetical protein